MLCEKSLLTLLERTLKQSFGFGLRQFLFREKKWKQRSQCLDLRFSPSHSFSVLKEHAVELPNPRLRNQRLLK